MSSQIEPFGVDGLWLLAPHPLQVHAGRNQLQSLLMAVTDGKLLSHPGGAPDGRWCPACRSSMAMCAAPPSGLGILGRGFDRCRALLVVVRSLGDVFSSALYFLTSD